MKIYKLPPEKVYEKLDTSTSGLSENEADNRLKKYGLNKIEEFKKTPLIYIFLANFYHVLALLLWAASILAFISGTPQLGVAIIAVIIINAIFSFWQEYEAEKATEALKKILPTHANVIRDGKDEEILAEKLTPGDVIVLEEGDNISADARLVESYQMKVDTSTLTGESRPVRKISKIPKKEHNYLEMPNIVFAGTSVSSGSGKAVIISTGMNTEFNKIASMTQAVKDEPSPLQKQINRLAQIIAVVAVSMGFILFVIDIWVINLPLVLGFTFAIGLMVANVPEGLLPTVTLALAASAKKMIKKNALIKRLSSVETLGSTTIICTDKTGTLTKNEMTVRKIWIPYEVIDVTGTGYDPEGEFLHEGQKVSHKEFKELELVVRTAAFCNDAKLIETEKSTDKYKIIGDPTEASLLVAARKINFNLEEELKRMPRIEELPFDSDRKSMSSIHQKKDKKVAYVKGAPKKIISLCNQISVENTVREFTSDEKDEVTKIHDEMASDGLRILAMAYKELSNDFKDYDPYVVEKDMIFTGMMAMHDPPRPEIRQAVEKCHQAGIRIIMITGDYGLTARAIAKEVGIISGDCTIIKGKKLDEMTDSEVVGIIKSKGNVIFARAVPEHKMRIASILEEEEEIVAMTGDGVNDAPALRKADIGVAMGITGTDVAKEASDMVLTDDNFATIVSAIKEGRTIYENIRKFITYIFAHETAEILPFVLMVVLKIPLPITVMQILAIDLGTDTLPALALGMGPSESDVMKRPPRSHEERLLNLPVIFRGYVYLGSIEALLVISGYFWVLFSGGWQWGDNLLFTDPLYLKATTMVFVGIVCAQIGNLLACQTTRMSSFKLGLFKNKWILRGILFEIVVILAIVYIPYLQDIFGTTSLGINDWLYVITFVPIMLFADELRKYWIKRKNILS
ncbi:MAG: cation-transporting P-type ATPase [Methanobacteriaceae archaeon]|jgi:P-type E1-E2 ATPase|nr:cation-transporting P-type ATPase [Methanobacteriaceae archaeon]